MQKKTLLTVAAVAIVGTTLFTATQAFAQTTTPSSDPMTSLVEKLSTKFGLNKDEVQAVFTEERQAHQAERQAQEEARLTQLVSEGKITEAQKQLIISKRQELMNQHQSEHESMQRMTADERRAAMEAHKQALEDWAAQNGIDPEYIHPFKMKMKGRGMHGMPLVETSATTNATATE